MKRSFFDYMARQRLGGAGIQAHIFMCLWARDLSPFLCNMLFSFMVKIFSCKTEIWGQGWGDKDWVRADLSSTLKLSLREILFHFPGEWVVERSFYFLQGTTCALTWWHICDCQGSQLPWQPGGILSRALLNWHGWRSSGGLSEPHLGFRHLKSRYMSLVITRILCSKYPIFILGFNGFIFLGIYIIPYFLVRTI